MQAMTRANAPPWARKSTVEKAALECMEIDLRLLVDGMLSVEIAAVGAILLSQAVRRDMAACGDVDCEDCTREGRISTDDPAAFDAVSRRAHRILDHFLQIDRAILAPVRGRG